MKAFKKALAVLMVFAMVITTMTAFDVTSASAKVKSIKVAKKVTVSVGKTKTVKVKVKTTGKTSKKFTVKVSKKKIVKVTKKKGKIKIKGLKAGKVKITIKSKANKKKKKTIKVTVVEPDVTMDVKQVDSRIYTLKFSKPVKIAPTNVGVQIKRMKSGNYKQNVKVEDLSTPDNQTYTVVLGESINYYDGCMIKFTVTGVNKKAIVKEVETYFPDRIRSRDIIRRVNDNTIIDDHWDTEDYTASDAYGTVKSVSGVPSGLKYTFDKGRIKLKGTLGKTGIFTITFVIEDEKGTTFTLRIVYVSGNDHTLTVYCPKQTVGIYENNKYSFGGFSRIYIAGGSGSYTVKSYDNAGIFNGDPDQDSEGIYYWDYKTKTIGTKTGVFTVEDNNSSILKTTGKAVVETKKTILVKGKVTTNSGKPVYDATVRALPQADSEQSFTNYGYTDRDGNYELQVIPGTYDMYAVVNDIYSNVYGKKISANATQNFKINAFTVNIKSSNPDLNPKCFLSWEDKTTGDIFGFSDSLYLKAGSYDIVSSGTAVPGVKYDASAKFTVKGDMTVTATVNATPAPVTEIYEGTTAVTSQDEYTYFTFVPTSTAEYRFYSSDSTGDPLLRVYDENGKEIAYGDDDDNYDFNFTVDLTKGKTYYLRYYDYDGIGETMNLNIYYAS
ncbi:MAG: Ig-like domain-containing protein [Eubacterium sp.]|nr:Ig-like domain-containing protein [Eubacterium sp.]